MTKKLLIMIIKSFTMKPKGQSLVELMLVIGLAAVFLPALATGLIASRDGSVQQRQRVQAVSILKEVEEAVRNVRDQDWTTFAVNGTYHPLVVGSSWTLATGSATVDGFTREVEISDVYRATTGEIVTSGGNLDLSTKKIEVTISWGLPYLSSMTTTSYLTRHLENAAYTETTQTQFNAGDLRGVAVRATSPASVADDGEVLLGAGGHSDWCAPDLVANTLDTPGQGYASFITAIEGKAFMGTGENSSGMAFMQVNISNNYPPVPSLIDDLDGAKANGVFGENDYAYITTDTNSEEVIIIDIRTTPFQQIGSFDSTGSTNGEDVYVVGNVGYMTAGNIFYSFNLDSRSGARAMRDSIQVTNPGTATSLMIVGNYAYISTTNSSRELQIIDISNPDNLALAGYANTPGGAGSDVFVDGSGNRAYLATANSATQPELYIINIATKTGERPIIGTGYNAGGMDPKAVTIVTGNRAILVGNGGVEYQVINIINENSPVSCGSEDVNFNIHDVASVIESDGDAYSYIVTSDANKELQIIAGGPGGSYAISGEFESQTFDPGYSTANNRFSAVFDEPTGSEIKFQVSMVNKLGGVCPNTSASYTFVGPSGTPSDYFEQASGVPVTFPFTTSGTYINPGECLRYKALMASFDGTSTPVLHSVTINYSP